MTTNWLRALRHSAAAMIVTLLVGGTFVWAQKSHGAIEAKVLDGSVAALTMNDRGEPDGWKLEDGQSVHIPPHAFAPLSDLVKPGVKVIATVVESQLPDGNSVNEAIVVEVEGHRFAITPPAPKAPPVKPTPPNKAESDMKAKGKIVEIQENKHGDADGFVLSDGTTVKFPPHVGESLIKDLKVGQQISVNGRRHETPKGEVHLHADEITSGGYTYTIDAPKPPKHGPDREDWMTKRQADEMLTELRAIRALLEGKKQ